MRLFVRRLGKSVKSSNGARKNKQGVSITNDLDYFLTVSHINSRAEVLL